MTSIWTTETCKTRDDALMSDPRRFISSMIKFGDINSMCLQSMILIEIQDTMAQPPSEEKSMKRATHTGIAVTVIFLSMHAIAFIQVQLCI